MKQAKFKRFFPSVNLAMGTDERLYEYQLRKNQRRLELYRRIVRPSVQNEFFELYDFGHGLVFVIAKENGDLPRQMVFENWRQSKPVFILLIDDMIMAAKLNVLNETVDCCRLELILPRPGYKVVVIKGNDKPLSLADVKYENGVLNLGEKYFLPGHDEAGGPCVKEIHATKAREIRQKNKSRLAENQWERVPFFKEYNL